MAARPRGFGRWLVLLVAAIVATAVPWLSGTTSAAFSALTGNPSNSLASNTLQAPTALTLTGTSPVALSWTATSSSWAAGTRVYRGTASGGPYSQVSQISGLGTTTYGENPGLGAYHYVVRSYFGTNWVSPNSNQVSRTTRTFVFKSTTAFTGSGNCNTGSQRERDMQQGFVPSDPEETLHRTGGTGTLNFCSDVFRVGEVQTAGTTTVNAYFTNTAGSTCNITATLYRNGTTSLGSGARTITDGTNTVTLFSWSFATSGFTAAANDRLNLTLTWQGVKACDDTDIHYDGTSTASSVTVPVINGV